MTAESDSSRIGAQAARAKQIPPFDRNDKNSFRSYERFEFAAGLVDGPTS
jgi:hypothetical protein